MRNYDPLTELKKLEELRVEFHNKQKQLVSEYLEDNQDTDFREVLKAIGYTSRIQAIKLHYDCLGGTLMESKRAVDKLLK